MKNLFLISLSFILISCQEVIDVELRDTAPQIVIEGVLTDHPGDAVVRVSTTNKFYEETSFKGVEKAEVSIKEENGNTYQFKEEEKGIYKRAGLVARPGFIYYLTVNVGGKTYTASSKMPSKVLLDTLFISNEVLVTEPIPTTNIAYKDPGTEQNNYLVEQYINNGKVDVVYLFDDDYTNGRPNLQKLYYFPENDEEKIKKGDTILVNMFNIERDMYKYWFSVLRSSTGQNGSASPANPVTNIKGGALGYFSAQTRQTKMLIAP